MKIVLHEKENQLMNILVSKALKGERCPTMKQLYFDHGIPSNFQPSKLARLGLLKIEIYAQNWRVIEIRAGRYKGKRTQEPPRGGKPYRIIKFVPGDTPLRIGQEKTVKTNAHRTGVLS